MEKPFSPYETPLTQEPTFIAQSAPQERGVKYVLFSFDGRIPRRTFWLWSIVSSLGWGAVLMLAVLLGEQGGIWEALAWIIGIPAFIVGCWSSFAIQVKRWHDHDKSWVWLLIGMIPYVGGIISFIYLGCMRGTHGDNRYGFDPT